MRHEDELRKTQYQNGIWEKALEHLSNRAADIYLLTERAKLEGADFAKLHQHAILLTEQIEDFIETLQIRWVCQNSSQRELSGPESTI